VVSIATAGVAARETGTASALLNSSRQLGASLGLAALGTAAYHRTGHLRTPEALTQGYAFGLTLDAVLLVAAALVALLVLRPRTDEVRQAGRPADAVDTTTPTELEGSALP
jgi:hypothetical protein